jgi:hypothetical protein
VFNIEQINIEKHHEIKNSVLKIGENEPIKPELVNHINTNDLGLKKKLFAKSNYPMFSYHIKKKISEYGYELSEKELKIMKSVAEDKGEIFDTNFKAFLFTNNKSESKTMRLKFKREDLLAKARFELSDKNISIRHEKVGNLEKISIYNIFNEIDSFSRDIILSEIKPSEMIIFLGKDDGLSDTIKKLSNINTKVLDSNGSESVRVKNNILNIKFDSGILRELPCVLVKDYGYIYNFKNNLLRIKRRREEIKEIIIEDTIFSNSIPQIGEMKDIEGFYSKTDIKLTTVKNELSKLVNEKLFIIDKAITNINNDFKLYIVDDQFVLEGNLNPTYLNVRKNIYSNMINLDE